MGTAFLSSSANLCTVFISHRVLQLEEKAGHQSSRHHGQRYQLNLVHVCKPHTQAVSCLAVDPEGKIVASGVRGSLVDHTLFCVFVRSMYSVVWCLCTYSIVEQWSIQVEYDCVNCKLQWSASNFHCTFVQAPFKFTKLFLP